MAVLLKNLYHRFEKFISMKKNLPLIFLILCCHLAAFAQINPSELEGETNSAASGTQKDMWELGLNAGHFMSIGDLDFDPSFAVGLHVRKALDYVFSLRLDLQYGILKGGNDNHPISDYTTTLMGGTIQGVASLNNLKWSNKPRKTNIYIFAGLGMNNFKVEYNEGLPGEGSYPSEWNACADFGAGIAFKISPKFNIGIEHKAGMVFGGRADLVDAWDNKNFNRTSFRDVLHYSNIRLNFNLGKSDSKTEPLYWVNPMDAVMSDITELKARPKLDLTDTDNDGVIDMLDQDNNTPEGAPVNAKGIALDSDGDGIKDYEDKEPFSPPGYTINSEGVSQAPEYMTEKKVNDLIDARLREYELSEAADNSASRGGWFLPMIHFEMNSSKLRKTDYAALANVAYVMKENPGLRILVTGYTDQTASEEYNAMLSYNRAKAAIDFLVSTHGINRENLVLNYGGEKENLVPTANASLMNRRVEFKIAKNETEMEAPGNVKTPESNFKGNKDAGY